MKNNEFSRIDLAYSLVFDHSPNLNNPDDLFLVHALHFLLAQKDVHLCVNSKNGGNYAYRLLPTGTILSKELQRDILYNILDKAHTSFDRDEMHVIESLIDSVNSVCTKSDICKQKLICSMAGYTFAKNNFDIPTNSIAEKFAIYSYNTSLLNSTQEAISTFDKLVKARRDYIPASELE